MQSEVIEQGNKYKITWFPTYQFARALHREYKSKRVDNLFQATGISMWGYRNIVVHRFFIPEIVYLLKKFKFSPDLINTIIENTWMSDYKHMTRKTKTNLDLVTSNMNGITLKDYQAEFIQRYPALKDLFQLRGMILSFDQGLGKTVTSMSTMVALNKEKTIVIAPKSTIDVTWRAQLEKFIKGPPRVYVTGDPNFSIDYDFFVFNYEAISKLAPIAKEFRKYNTGIIVDESHNFLTQSNRTSNLVDLTYATKCSDLLLLSGTPLKAVGSELLSMLMLLDRFIDEEAKQIFRKTFGLSSSLANDVIHARLDHIMYRKVKEDVLDLPKKTEYTIKIKIPDGDKYTLDEVKKKASVYAKERAQYHREHMRDYIDTFNRILTYAKNETELGGTPGFAKFIKNLNKLRNIQFSTMNPDHVALAHEIRQYEDTYLFPALPAEMKREYREVSSAVKYVGLKVRGEVIGNLLIKMRTEMTSEMVAYANLPDMIHKAMKKTIIFTSFIETCEAAYDYLTKHGFKKAIKLHGQSEETVKGAVEKFTKDPSYNPLVSTINMLVTGVTLIEANNMVFLNKPYRFTDFAQASDRIHRIGQDTPVFINTIILDTGSKPNLSTRMEDIMEWSRDSFNDLVGGSNLRIEQIMELL